MVWYIMYYQTNSISFSQSIKENKYIRKLDYTLNFRLFSWMRFEAPSTLNQYLASILEFWQYGKILMIIK